jgi:hypothetical protein
VLLKIQKRTNIFSSDPGRIRYFSLPGMSESRRLSVELSRLWLFLDVDATLERLRSLEHHFQSGCALKCASFTYHKHIIVDVLDQEQHLFKIATVLLTPPPKNRTTHPPQKNSIFQKLCDHSPLVSFISNVIVTSEKKIIRRWSLHFKLEALSYKLHVIRLHSTQE